MPEAGERHLAQELRGVGMTGYEQPEWKTAALGKAPTYGISDSRSIMDQRNSLPIYKLKDQLIQAVNDNQVRRDCNSKSPGCTTGVVQERMQWGVKTEPWLQHWFGKRSRQACWHLMMQHENQTPMNRLLLILRVRRSGAGGHRRDGVGQDDADDAVPGGGGLHLQGQDRVHAATPRCRHVRCQARGRGGGFFCGARGTMRSPLDATENSIGNLWVLLLLPAKCRETFQV